MCIDINICWCVACAQWAELNEGGQVVVVMPQLAYTCPPPTFHCITNQEPRMMYPCTHMEGPMHTTFLYA